MDEKLYASGFLPTTNRGSNESYCMRIWMGPQ